MKTETNFLFNRKDTAAAFGVSTQAIGVWNIEPVQSLGKTGNRIYYDIREVIQERLKQARNSSGAGGDLSQQQLRLARNKAEKSEIELQVIKGELLPLNEIVGHWENLFLAFRAKILAIPNKAAHVALNATSLEDVETSLELFLLEALEELSGDGMPDEYKQSRQAIAVSANAAAKTNGQ